ncbi:MULTISPECIES: hypothetical protein [unclassified Amycolatopsis]|nr:MULTISPECIES: hypothetical protein [unclassified Amycolatopsis]MDS0140119.1 hypothetical protein [Amycolatopsis sp. 505]MDS0148673.1 hypothetical protein [Amycolatopsis sp. CM201R]
MGDFIIYNFYYSQEDATAREQAVIEEMVLNAPSLDVEAEVLVTAGE